MIREVVIILVLLCSMGSGLNAQNEPDSIPSIMDRGMALHDEGKYEMSLVEYRKALELEPKNGFVNYEMALSYYYLGDKVHAEEYAQTASKEESESGVQGVILLGSLYDEQGKGKKSIKTYKSAIKRFGDYYLIWFNLGVTYNGMGQHEEAAKAFENALANKLDHSSSHYALGTMKQVQGKRAEAMLPFYFFLMLEPDSDRSKQAVASLNDLWSQGVSRDDDENVTISIGSVDDKDPMHMTDMMISILESSDGLEQNEGKSDFELYHAKTTSLFKHLAEIDLGNRDDYYTQYYIPFFNRIAESEHSVAFTHYVLHSLYPESRKWVELHTEQLESLFNWLDETE